MIRIVAAFRAANKFLCESRTVNGEYRLTRWPAVRTSRLPKFLDVGKSVVALRIMQRLRIGFLNPIEDAIYVTAGLRELGFDATFHVGRQLFPDTLPASMHAWVECHGKVFGTSLPVKEEYIEVVALP